MLFFCCSCHSYVGRIGMIPQQLNLQDACIYHVRTLSSVACSHSF